MTGSDDSAQFTEPIDDMAKLEAFIAQGYKLKGPRKSPEADLKAIERFFKKGHIFFPESCLLEQGCRLVEPSVLTKGLKFAFKTDDDELCRYHKSKYALVKGDQIIPLYLKSPEHD
ncbi:MAG: hypothetical protein JSV49_11990 [Thermoplasmata archaeon]|nr:MAG: hypothetical protein JSV49_11990 [Thermoplasmata archaeon]